MPQVMIGIDPKGQGCAGRARRQCADRKRAVRRQRCVPLWLNWPVGAWRRSQSAGSIAPRPFRPAPGPIIVNAAALVQTALDARGHARDTARDRGRHSGANAGSAGGADARPRPDLSSGTWFCRIAPGWRAGSIWRRHEQARVAPDRLILPHPRLAGPRLRAGSPGRGGARLAPSADRDQRPGDAGDALDPAETAGIWPLGPESVACQGGGEGLHSAFHPPIRTGVADGPRDGRRLR